MLKVLLAALLLIAPATADAQLREVPLGTGFDWSFATHGSPVRYRSGPVTVTIRGERSDEWEGAIEPVVAVEMAGFAPVEVRGSVSSEGFDHRVTVGRWPSGGSYVLVQSYTGGAHCCNDVQAVIPEQGRLRVVHVGTWDGEYLDELPTDLDGDGRLDFVFADNAFLYRFTSYAESFPPPQIINIVDGGAANVSDRPGFRPLFEAARREARELCLDVQDVGRNGACAAYVAAAARVGRFEEAWGEMLRAHERSSNWGLEHNCRVPLVDGACPQGQEVSFANFPEALRRFLVETGYIAR